MSVKEEGYEFIRSFANTLMGKGNTQQKKQDKPVTSDKAGSGGISEVDRWQRPVSDIQKTKATAEGAYSEADDDAIQARADTKQRDIVNNFVDNPELQTRLDPNMNNPHASNNFRGNINGRSAGSTLQLSRLADAFNSQLHASPTDIGARSVTGSGISGPGTGIEGATPKRWNPIETQEMRQMRNNERLDEKQRGLDIDREARIRNYPLDLQQNADKMQSELASYSAKTGIDFGNLLKKSVVGLEYDANGQTRLQQFMSAFNLEIQNLTNDKIKNMLLKYTNNPVVMQMLAQVYKAGFQSPALAQWYKGKYMEQIVNDMKSSGKYSDADIAQSLPYFDGVFGTASMTSLFNGSVNGIEQGYSPGFSPMNYFAGGVFN